MEQGGRWVGQDEGWVGQSMEMGGAGWEVGGAGRGVGGTEQGDGLALVPEPNASFFILVVLVTSSSPLQWD